jgi:hypothetical protein
MSSLNRLKQENRVSNRRAEQKTNGQSNLSNHNKRLMVEREEKGRLHCRK